MLKKSNTVQKILFLLIIFVVIAGEQVLSAMGVWRTDRILWGLIAVCMLGILLFRDKTKKE
jgi:hypothetical protein